MQAESDEKNNENAELKKQEYEKDKKIDELYLVLTQLEISKKEQEERYLQILKTKDTELKILTEDYEAKLKIRLTDSQTFGQQQQQ